jgi:thiaminase/transcriptional activator TenA
MDKFRFYMQQDYYYLIEFTRALAITTAKAPDLQTMRELQICSI